jgi:hypothetical protein
MSSAASRRSGIIRHAVFAQIEALEARVMLSSATATPAQTLPNPPVQPPPPIFGTEPLQGVVGTPISLSPSMMVNEWGINQIYYQVGTTVAPANGAGQTIAIIDAYGSPTIVNDAEQFNAYWGLSDADSTGNFFLTVTSLAPTANSEQDSPQVIADWGTETSLDVEWAHVIAPGAHIDLIEAPSQSLLDLLDANVYAEALPGVTVVSNSWGIPTGDITEPDRYDGFLTPPTSKSNVGDNVSVFFSSGDTSQLEYPSASDQAIGVGGMTIDVSLDGDIINLGPWADSGGGSDTDYAPPYNVPYVSGDADPLTGVWIYDSSTAPAVQGIPTIDGGWIPEFGGTSLACPLMAAYTATLDQGLVMQGDPTLSTTALQNDILIAGEGSPDYFIPAIPLPPGSADSYPKWPTPNGPIPDIGDIPSNGNTGFGMPDVDNFTPLIETGAPALDYLEGETHWTETGDPTYNDVTTMGNGLPRLYFQDRMPATVVAGQAVPNLIVDVDTDLNALNTGYNGQVTVSLLSGGTLLGTTTVTAVDGVATFSNITITKTGSDYVIEATADNIISAETNPFNIVAAPATSMFVSSQPTSTWQYTATSNIAITLEDVFGNIAANDSSTVTLTVAAGPGTFSGPSSSAVDNGVALFEHLVFTVPGTYQLEASDGVDGLTPVFTDEFNVVTIPITRRSLFNGGTLSEPALVFQQQRNAAIFAAAGPPPGAAFFADAVVAGGQAAVNNVTAAASTAASSGDSGSDVDQVLDSAANLRSDDAAAAVLNP